MIGDDVNVQKLWVAVQNWVNRNGVNVNSIQLDSNGNPVPVSNLTLSDYLITNLGFVITAP